MATPSVVVIVILVVAGTGATVGHLPLGSAPVSMSMGGTAPSERPQAPAPLWVTASASRWSSENQTPDTVGFTAVISGGTAPFQENWNFGDGSPNASGLAPTHTYDQNGSFLVLLTVVDAEAHHATSTLEVDTVYYSVPVSVSAEASPQVVSANAPHSAVSFAVTNYPGDPVAYVWDFGDGQNSTNATPTHTYSTAGEYLVHLSYEYAFNFAGSRPGATWNVSAELTVLVLPDSTVPPVAVVLATPNIFPSFFGCVPLTWGVNLLPIVAGGWPPYTDSWSFGDGSSGVSSGAINHTYHTYVDTVHLTVTDPNGSTATASAIVGGFPVPAIVTTCPPNPATLLITYLVIGGILAASAVIVAVFWLPRWRSRRLP